MNEIKLRGYLRDIQHSHTINGVDYDKANLIVPNVHTNDDDIITLCFKHFSNHYSDGELIDILGNIRSYSQKISDSKNKVSIYVFTYFDAPTDEEVTYNSVSLDGRICKMDKIRSHSSGPDSLSFIIANNIILPEGKGKINNYIPVVCWGKLASELSALTVSDKIVLYGELQSRTYKKQVEDAIELKIAHEIVLSGYELI